jgi:hypothetical protein
MFYVINIELIIQNMCQFFKDSNSTIRMHIQDQLNDGQN